MKVCRYCSQLHIGSSQRCCVCGARLRRSTNGMYVLWGLIFCALLATLLAHIDH